MKPIIRKEYSKVTNRFFTSEGNGSRKDIVEGGCRITKGKNRFDTTPFFSVITICYNNVVELKKVVDSVVNQKFQNFEYIIIDGASSDGSLDYLKSRNDEIDYFISEKDDGIYDAINKGLQYSSGEYVILIHADDILKSDALFNASKFIRNNPCDIAFGDSIYIKDNFPVAFKPGRNYGEETILRGIVGPHEGAFVSANTYNQMGGYDSSMDIAADHKFFRNCILKGKVIKQIDRVVNYKEVGGDSFNKEKEYAENKHLLSEMFSSIDDDLCKELYSIKNYQKLTPEKLSNLYNLLSTRNMPGNFYRVLSKSLLRIMMGDSPSEAHLGDNAKKAKEILTSAVDNETIVLAIGKIKGLSGGAERVLVELANYLNSKNIKVTVVCADGKAGNNFYHLDQGIEFIDLNEQPVSALLDAQGGYDLSSELEEIVFKATEDMLSLADANIEVRENSKSWQEFKKLNGGVVSAEHDKIRSDLLVQREEWLKRYKTNITRWRNFLKITKPKMIVPFMISCIPQVFLANRKCGVPLILSNHNNPSRDYYTQDEWNPLPLDKVMRLFSVSSAKRSIWLLPEYVDYLPPQCRKNAFVLANPISPAKTLVPYHKRENLLLAVGRYTNVKNFQLLIKVIGKLKAKLPDWRLEIYGSGPEADNLAQLIKDEGVESQVYLMSPTSYIESVYNRASIFLSSSTVEGFPLTLCEAMSHGLPAMGRQQCSGVNTLVEDGLNGKLIEEFDISAEVEKYAETLLAIINNKKLREKMSKKAIETMKPYHPSIIYNTWLKALNLGGN
jgi:glycosyltransferase involved in cell wall biosynthesis